MEAPALGIESEPQLEPMQDPLTHCSRLGIEPLPLATPAAAVRFLAHCTAVGTPLNSFFTACFVIIVDVSLLLSEKETVNYISLYNFLSFIELLLAQFFCLLGFFFKSIFNFNELSKPLFK